MTRRLFEATTTVMRPSTLSFDRHDKVASAAIAAAQSASVVVSLGYAKGWCRTSDTNHWHTRSAVTTTSRWVGWSIPSMPSLSYNAARAVCARRVRPYAPDVGHVS